MSRKSKGINAERELIHKFWSLPDWAAVRVAGSGSMRYPSPDIIATNKQRILAIECKTSREPSKYILREDIEQIRQFSQLFGAEPWIAVKFNAAEWYFLTVEDLEETGKAFLVTDSTARAKGLLFEEVIKEKNLSPLP
ncbi:Holliday junction resolvase [Candidatus Woesearchaeota archaeon]|nr:Holliday junction resolvase [Candidatus Woesearchaeota archaeon]